MSSNVTEPKCKVIYVIYNTKMLKPEDFLSLFDPGGWFIFPAKENIKTIIMQKKHDLYLRKHSR